MREFTRLEGGGGWYNRRGAIWPLDLQLALMLEIHEFIDEGEDELLKVKGQATSSPHLPFRK